MFTKGIFAGYTIMVWLVIINGAIMGQTVSAVMKYADNVRKVFSTSVAMFMSPLLSSLFFAFVPDVHLFLGLLIVGASLFLYHGSHNKIISAQETTGYEEVKQSDREEDEPDHDIELELMEAGEGSHSTLRGVGEADDFGEELE
jgi:hypothetical protein